MNNYLQVTDYVGVSFWLVSVAMVAATVFFLYEGMHAKSSWRISLLVAGLVTLIAAIHYYYMREYWVNSGESPIVYRYIDWLLTVPLQMIEFYLILVAAGLADKCEIQVSYAIGVAEPTSVMVQTFGTNKIEEEKIVELVNQNFDLRPYGILKMLDLLTKKFIIKLL